MQLERAFYVQIAEDIRAHAERLGAVIDASHRQQLVLVSRHRKPRGRAPWGGKFRYVPVHHLVGRDDGHLFAHRLPSTVATVSAALEYMEPAPVRRARRQGLPVERQGDVLAVGHPRPDQMRATCSRAHVLAGTRHRIVADGKPWLTLHHDGGEHPDVVLPSGYCWRLYRARAVGGCGD